MKSLKNLCEDMNSMAPLNYSGPGFANQNQKVNIGQANVSIMGNTLTINTNNNSIALALTTQQMQQMSKELKRMF
jgi:hypothetical protein